jgi:hypothetical protein
MLATSTLATQHGWLGSTVGMVAADALALAAGQPFGDDGQPVAGEELGEDPHHYGRGGGVQDQPVQAFTVGGLARIRVRTEVDQPGPVGWAATHEAAFQPGAARSATTLSLLSWVAVGLNVAVVGVAKTASRTASHAVPVRRGGALRPLYVTSAGIPAERAAALVAGMAGPYRLPDALRRVDALARSVSS